MTYFRINADGYLCSWRDDATSDRYRSVGNMIEQVVKQYLLVTAKTTHRAGMRTATEKGKKALEFLVEQPDPLGNITMPGG